MSAECVIGPGSLPKRAIAVDQLAFGQQRPEGLYYTTFADGSVRSVGESTEPTGGWGVTPRGGPRVQYLIVIDEGRRTGHRRSASWAEYYEPPRRIRSVSGYTEEDEWAETALSFPEWIASLIDGLEKP